MLNKSYKALLSSLKVCLLVLVATLIFSNQAYASEPDLSSLSPASYLDNLDHDYPLAEFAYFIYPRSASELINASDKIVVATVTEVVGTDTFYGYTSTGERITDISEFPNEDTVLSDDEIAGHALIDTFFVLEVSETLIGEHETVIIVSVPGNPNDEYGTAYYPLPTEDETNLYFLSEQPDGESFGLTYGPVGRIDISSEVAHVMDARNNPLILDGKVMESQTLIDNVRELSTAPTTVLLTENDTGYIYQNSLLMLVVFMTMIIIFGLATLSAIRRSK